MSDTTLFEETFTLTSLNAAKYDRVARLYGSNSSNDTSMSLDINTELFPCSVGESLQMVLATTLNLDGTKDETSGGWREKRIGEEASLADAFDYVCRGRIYKFEEGGEDMLKIYVSFGGLLLFLEGPWKKLTGLRMDQVYMLVKK